MSDPEPVTVPPKVYQQLEALRESGAVNMFTEVKRGLTEMDFHEARDWVDNNPERYIEGFRERGFQPADDD